MQTRVVKRPSPLNAKAAETLTDMPANLSLRDFTAETHLVVVLCVIFSSHLSIYHLARSFVVLLHVFSSCRSLLYPWPHCIGSSSLRSGAVLYQAGKINNALPENSNSFGRRRDKIVAQAAQETLLITCNVFLPTFQP